MIFESKKEYDELIDEIERELTTTKKKEPIEDKEDENIGGRIPINKIRPPSAGHESGKKQDAWVENFESRVLKILKEKEAVGEVQKISKNGQAGVLGHNNPEVNPSTKSSEERARFDDYGSKRKKKGSPESQKKEPGLQDLFKGLTSETEAEDETKQNQQESEEETS
jgi:hypothetical protein